MYMPGIHKASQSSHMLCTPFSSSNKWTKFRVFCILGKIMRDITIPAAEKNDSKPVATVKPGVRL